MMSFENNDSVTRSIARSLCDSWVSCYHDLQSAWYCRTVLTANTLSYGKRRKSTSRRIETL